MSLIIGWFTSKLAGPIATGAAVLLAVLLAVMSLRLGAAQHTAESALQARDKALTSLGTCQANAKGLEASISAQNAAVETWRAAGDAKVKAVSEAVSVALKSRAAAEARAAALMRPAVGVDACVRMQSADRAVLEVLK